MKQEAKPPLGDGNSSVGVPEEGLEPSNPYECRILSPVRMPIPPLRHIVKVETRQILTQYKVFPIAVNQELETTVFLGGECA